MEILIVITHAESLKKIMTFGPYLGLTLEQISGMTGGFDYLSRLQNERSVPVPLKEAIRVFLGVSEAVPR